MNMLQIDTSEKKVSNRVIELEFLYLDLNTCTRCVGTNENLEAAIQSVADVLAFTKTELSINKILIETEEQARAHQFVTSPTIRVNGRDIALEFRESQCDSCTDLCGCEEGTNCREWLYEGAVYTEAPVGMIVEAILSEIFRDAPAATATSTTDAASALSAGVSPTDSVPDNLKNFFAAKTAPETAVNASCCSETEQQTCCEPAAKADCCGPANASGGCGCQ
jgi:hypothetical protein